MKMVVTGGAGFIGSTLVRMLLKEGHEVTVLDDFSTGKQKNLESVQDQIRLVRGTIEDPSTVLRALNDAHGVFHLAAVASVQRSMTEPETCHRINVDGFLNVLEGCRKAGVRRCVYSTSAATYGEIDRFPLQESETCEPISPYGLHKLINEEYAGLYQRRGWVETRGLRYFNVFGPRQDPNGDYAAVVPKFITAFLGENAPTIFGDGTQSRDFLYVEDIALANLLAMSSEKGGGQVFNVCAGHETSLLDLIDMLQKLVNPGIKANFEPARSGDIRRSVGDPGKAERILGFRPQHSVLQGLKKTIDSYR